MGVKYTIPYKSLDNQQWRVDIANNVYVGDPIHVRGVSEQAAILTYEPEETDDPFSVYIRSKLTLNIVNEGQISLNELRSAYDKDYTVSWYRNDSLRWRGYLDTAGIQRPLQAAPFAVTLSAVDGLSLLSGIDYVHADLPGLTYAANRCPMNYIRQILFANLGITLPIRWTNNLTCTAFPDDDVFTGGVRWSVNNEGFYSYQSGSNGTLPGAIRKCDYILTGILKSMQCRIFQADGMWIIRRIPDIVSGSVLYKQIAGNLGVMVPSQATQNLIEQIGRTGYPFIREDAVMTNKPGVKTCRAVYNANVRENILPNGSQDTVHDPSFDLTPTIWGGYPDSEPTEINSVTSLDGRFGYATELDNAIGDKYFTMISDGSALYENGLPIDAKIQVKKINFGFLLSPENFPIIPGPDEVIDWTTKPMQLKVILNFFGTRYFLNDYGFWVTDDTTIITIVVDNLRLHDVVQINFDAFQGVIIPEPVNVPAPGDTCDIQVVFIVKAGIVYVLDNISITIDNGNDVFESTTDNTRNTEIDERELNISSSFSGYMLSNFMSSPFESDAECYFKDALAYEGTLTGLTANVIMRYRYKSSEIFNGSINTRNADWSFDSIYMIDGEGLEGAKFLPLNASYNPEKCEVNNLIAIECRNDFIPLTEKFYSSNDTQLSN